MLQQALFEKNSMFVHQPFDSGPKEEKLDVLDSTIMENDYIIPMTLMQSLESEEISFLDELYCMQEFRRFINKKILKDKSNGFKKISKTRLLSLISLPDSIGKEKDYATYWNKFTMELSKELSLPIKTESVDSDLNCYNGSLINIKSNSWFSMTTKSRNRNQVNWEKIYSLLSTFLSPEIMDFELQKIEEKMPKGQKKQKKSKGKLEAERAYNLRIYFTKQEYKVLLEWFGARRFIYNKCVAFRKEKVERYGENIDDDVKEYREMIINDEVCERKYKEMLDYPYDFRDEVVQDFLKNVKSNKAKVDQSQARKLWAIDNSTKTDEEKENARTRVLENRPKFEMKFKSLKNQHQQGDSISILAKYWNMKESPKSKRYKFFSKIFNRCKASFKDKNLASPKELDYTARLKITPSKKTFLTIARPLIQKEKETTLRIGVIDPGGRDFLTIYNVTNQTFIVIGKSISTQRGRYLSHLRKLQSKKTKEKNKQKKYNLRKAIKRVQERLQNLTLDLHKKASKYLCEEFDLVLYPRLNFHSCKKLSKRSKQNLASLSHCALVDRTKTKSYDYLYDKAEIIEVKEELTTQGCHRCGVLNKKIGKSKIFNCEKCHLKMDRDENSAINIFLKFVTELSLGRALWPTTFKKMDERKFKFFKILRSIISVYS